MTPQQLRGDRRESEVVAARRARARALTLIDPDASVLEVPFPMADVAPDGTVRWCNAAWKAMAHTGRDDALRVDSATGMDRGDLVQLMTMVHATIESPPPAGTTNSVELDVPNLGLFRWSRCHGSVGATGGALLSIVPLRALPDAGSGPDPDEFIAAFEYLSEGIVVLDEHLRIRIATGFASNLMGVAGYAFEGRMALDEIHPDDRERAAEQILSILDRPGEQQVLDVRVRDAAGEYRWLEAIATNLFDHPIVGGVLVMLRDIGTRKELEAQLAFRALRDPLTGLPNRAALIDHLTDVIRTQHESDQSLAVMFLDLDNLKDVNDSVGHDAGDALLVEVARRLSGATRADDLVGRLGGDEFVVVCPHLADRRSAVELAERIRRSVTGRSVVASTDVFVTASVGVTVVPPGLEILGTPEEAALRMLRDADTAMYEAKSRGRARVVVFSSEMHQRAHDRLQLTAGLDRAISDDQLSLLYQPIFDLPSGVPVALEALVRWQHPGLGQLVAERFVALAEESGLMVPIGNWALARAAADLGEIRRRAPGREHLAISVNVSAVQLIREDFVALVEEVLRVNGLDAHALILELAESTLVEEARSGLGVLDALRRLGVRVALDDFGTGLSSLSNLRRFAVDELKLDATLLDDIVDEPVSTDIARAIIQLAHAMGMTVVAEAVETPEQLAVLEHLGCDRAQGFALCCPAPLDTAIEALDLFARSPRVT